MGCDWQDGIVTWSTCLWLETGHSHQDGCCCVGCCCPLLRQSNGREVGALSTQGPHALKLLWCTGWNCSSRWLGSYLPASEHWSADAERHLSGVTIGSTSGVTCWAFAHPRRLFLPALRLCWASRAAPSPLCSWRGHNTASASTG